MRFPLGLKNVTAQQRGAEISSPRLSPAKETHRPFGRCVSFAGIPVQNNGMMGYLRAILLRTAWMVLFWFDQPMPPHQMPSTKQAMHRGTKTYLPKGMNHFMMGLSEPS